MEEPSAEVASASVLSLFDKTQPVVEHTFEAPATVPEELKELYEEHRLKMSPDYRPWAPPTEPREVDEAMFRRTMRLKKGDRKNPMKNADIMPEKEVIEETW